MTFRFTSAATGVDSEVLKNVYYNANEQELYIQFQSENSFDRLYYAVPPQRADELFAADSKGGYYNGYIKNWYSSTVANANEFEWDFGEDEGPDFNEFAHDVPAPVEPEGDTLTIAGEHTLAGDFANFALSFPEPKTYEISYESQAGETLTAIQANTEDEALGVFNEAAKVLNLNVRLVSVTRYL